MKYRKISEWMTREEVEMLLELLLPGSTIKELDRLEDSNCINVSFEWEGQEEVLIFYPDDIDNIPEGLFLENQHLYQIYMIANGYSSIWIQKADRDLEIGTWFLETKNLMEERRREQLKIDDILKELLKARDEARQDLQQGAETAEFREQMEKYFLIEEQLKERLEHISYVVGISDALTMLRAMQEKIDFFHVATELEILLSNYKDLHGLLETFAEGAKVQVGNYDVTQGIFAVSTALDEKNRKLEEIFDHVFGDE